MTQQELGSMIGKSKATISLWETGEREPMTNEEIVRLASVLNTTYSYLTETSNIINGGENSTPAEAIKQLTDELNKSGGMSNILLEKVLFKINQREKV